MYFPFFVLHDWCKRSAVQPQTIYSEFPLFYHRLLVCARHLVHFTCALEIIILHKTGSPVL